MWKTVAILAAGTHETCHSFAFQLWCVTSQHGTAAVQMCWMPFFTDDRFPTLCEILCSLSLSWVSSEINGWVEGTDAIIALVNGKIESQNCSSSLVVAADLTTSTCTQAGHQPVNTSWINCSRNVFMPGHKIKIALSLLPAPPPKNPRLY